MNRTDYLRLRVQKDLYKYIVLRQDGKSAEEIADALEVTARGTIGNDVIREMRDESLCRMKALIDQEFSLERIKKGHSFVSEIPQGFGPELVDKVAGEYKDFLNSESMLRSEDLVCDMLVRKIEKVAWRSGLRNMSEGILLFIERTLAKAASYRACVKPCDYAKELNAAYAKAQKITLRDRISSGASDNIINLRNCMRDAAMQECENAMYENIAGFLQSFAENERLKGIADYISSIVKAASDNEAQLPENGLEAELDSAYDKAYPIGFYRRNIEKVDECKAFYMSVMFAFARYESLLSQKGYLVDGEILIVTKTGPESASDMLSFLISLLTDFVEQGIRPNEYGK